MKRLDQWLADRRRERAAERLQKIVDAKRNSAEVADYRKRRTAALRGHGKVPA